MMPVVGLWFNVLMHELSIAMQIVDRVAAALPADERAPVVAVDVRVGVLSGVVPEALNFVWDMAAADSVVAGADLRIEVVPAVVWCPRCVAEVQVEGGTMVCPVCGAPTPRVVRGRELEILSMELGDDRSEPAADGGGPYEDSEEE